MEFFEWLKPEIPLFALLLKCCNLKAVRKKKNKEAIRQELRV